MNDLIDEVRTSFEKTRDEQGEGPVSLIRGDEEELAPGMTAMRSHYADRVLVILRRGYRHFAGSTMSTDSEVLLQRTSAVMLEPMVSVLLEAFADGVMVGHGIDPTVRMCFYFNNPEHLYHDPDFREASSTMASGFGQDTEVHNFFARYMVEGVDYLAKITGFAPTEEADPAKVWDVWMMMGNASMGAAYLAGHVMGTGWRERDVLDGIEIATEEDPRGPQGENG